MKKSDLIFLIVALIVLLPFFISDRVYSYYLLATIHILTQWPS